MSNLNNNTTQLEALLAKVNALPEAGGVDLPELTNEGSASDLFQGKELINGDGSKVTGTFTIDEELITQDDLIAQIQTALEGKAGGGDPVLQDKTITPTTSSQTVTADSGYDGLDTVTVNAIPSTYVKPTATKSATIYTPTTSNQTIAAGTYCSGAQTIKGDANLKAENIAEGVSIFGVTGTHSGSSSSGGVETCTVTLIGEAPLGGQETVYYTDNSSTVKNIAFPDFGETKTITVMKNSMLCSYWVSISISSENISEVISQTTLKVFFVTGDSSMNSM